MAVYCEAHASKNLYVSGQIFAGFHELTVFLESHNMKPVKRGDTDRMTDAQEQSGEPS